LFALANDAPALLPPAVLGPSIFTFVSDPTTIHIYEELFRCVAGGRGPIGFSIRCDSPPRPRFLYLVIQGRPGGVRMSSTVLRIEARPAQPLLASQRERSDALLRMCSWCKKVDVGETWLEVEAAVQRLALFEEERLPRITHGMCQHCHEAMGALILRS